MTRLFTRPVLSRFLRLALLVLLVTGVATVVAHLELIHPEAIQSQVARAGAWGPVLFVLVFAAGAVLFVPGSVMVLAGGALFGPWLGTLYNLAGSMAGATAAFLISRYLAREWAERRAGRRLRLMMLGVREEGWRFVLALRLAGVPFFLLNYVLGLTPVGLVPYAVASLFGMLPSIAAFTYAGYIGLQAVSGGEGFVGKLALAIALVGVAVLVPVVVRLFRKRSGDALR
jgi:uncharacterized membrane protein YdjX (TVP38/TMEM64 family)